MEVPPPERWDDLMAVRMDGSEAVVVRRNATHVGPEPQITLFKIDLSGDTVLSRTLRYDPIPVTREWQDSVSLEWAAPQAERKGITVDRLAGAYRDAADWPAHRQAVSEVLVGADGTTWLRRGVPRADSIRWDILDGDFGAVGFTFLPISLEVKRVSRSAVWGVELDEWDIPWIIRYDLRPAG